MSSVDPIAAARTRAAIFALSDRGLLAVGGGDRVRFLQGQLSNDVAALDAAGPRAGCYALLLTPQGRIVADLHVIARPDALWLETRACAVPAALARLAKYVIADDVTIADQGAAWARFGVEGPRAAALLEAASGTPPPLAPDDAASCRIGGTEVVVAAFGWSGERAFQVLAPAAAGPAVAAALEAAGAPFGAVCGSAAALEVLRVEAGVPRTGVELGEDVLPAEARLLERAVSFTKGCYTGQEVVARMQSRGRVGHLLVGLSLAPTGDALPAPGAALLHDGARVGAVTSVARSAAAGPIALGFVRTAHADAGTRLALDAGAATVVELPFVRSGSAEAP